MKSAWRIMAIGLGCLLILNLLWQYFVYQKFEMQLNELQATSGIATVKSSEDIPETPPVVDPSEVKADDDPFSGNEDAKVTLIIFDDFECPFCAKMHESVNTVRDNFSDEELRIVFRDFPLGFHEQALPAAKAAGAAHEQGKFFAMSDLIFENRDSLSDAKYLEFAKQLDLDIDQFEADMEKQEIADEIGADVAAGETYGVTGTPAVFLDGVQIGGFLEIGKLEEAIREKL